MAGCPTKFQCMVSHPPWVVFHWSTSVSASPSNLSLMRTPWRGDQTFIWMLVASEKSRYSLSSIKEPPHGRPPSRTILATVALSLPASGAGLFTTSAVPPSKSVKTEVTVAVSKSNGRPTWADETEKKHIKKAPARRAPYR